MFLHLSVVLFTGGVSASVHAGIHPPPLGTHPLPLGRHPPTPGQTPPWADTPLARHPPLPYTSPPADGHCSGRYASYWNAFLFVNSIASFVCSLLNVNGPLVGVNQTCRCIILTCMIYHYPTRAIVNTCPIPEDRRIQGLAQTGVPFVYAPFVYWKVRAYQNVTPVK